jgi:two-component system chemotaxis response regulator CheB
MTSMPPVIGVMIVDDSFLMRRVIRDIVERDGRLQVAGEAGDGAEALRRLHDIRPDVVLLDVEMPRMDGLEFLAHARLQTAAPVLVISSITQQGSPQAMQALALGAADLLPKPSGVLSMDYDASRGDDLLAAIHRCTRHLAAPATAHRKAS